MASMIWGSVLVINPFIGKTAIGRLEYTPALKKS